ncbi:MAG TPA: maleylpyruvate isomerase family mycothiol-dependent enzyme [Streptomyces sp.]|nr:maleylpyruvate isomerase family mycothiol-dependent enzyme [Streptomyces sp.]HZF87033.1 maleylpyruvate isomerase family mycothiol-dependent enzyme [Streptomyces sp.]
METGRYVEILDREGRLLASAAERAGTGAAVPTCPDWQVRDLLRHTGAVHRWAASYVREGHAERRPLGDPPDLDGAELVAWYREAHRRLVDTLAGAAPDVACWAFLPAPSPLEFWVRRQAHETAVHRFDAEAALGGGTPSRVESDFAADGIDELLRGFQARSRSRVRTDEPRMLRVRATDTDTVWTVRLSPKPPVTTRDASGEADCELSGRAEELYLALWNRLPVPSVTGDRALADLWRERSAV